MEITTTKNKSIPILITLFFLEIFIGGPGNVFTIFQIPARQVIFALLCIFSLFHLATHKVKLQSDDLIIISLILWACVSAFIGLIKGHDMEIVFNDISPMMFFLVYFPLRVYFSKYEISYEYFLKILTHSSIFMSLFIIIVYVIMSVGFEGGAIVKMIFFDSEALWFRGNGAIFYSGMVYILVSIILLLGKLIDCGRLSVYEAGSLPLSFVVLIMSETKGLILALVVACFMLLFLARMSVIMKFKLILIGVICASIALYSFNLSRFSNIGTDIGTEIRLETINESLTAINDNIFLGNGFGFELKSKKYHQENSFLDIAVEQGSIGVILYSILFFQIYIKRRRNIYLAISVATVVLMSLTNPYINNPLGISLILLTMIFFNNEFIKDKVEKF